MDASKAGGGVFAGVDAHKDDHALCVLDALGRKVSEGSFPADEAGYDALARAIGEPSGCAAVGVEGTASYGAGLARRLLELGYPVVEVLRPKRGRRRRGEGKSDPADAERAARDAAAGKGTSVPKSQDGWVEAVRFLTAAREIAVRTSTACMNCAKGLVVTAPEPVRAGLSGMGGAAMMAELARERAGSGLVEDALLASLRTLALTWAEAKGRAAGLKDAIAALVRENAPALLGMRGCGPVCAARLAIAAGDNPERLRGEASFAALCGASPVEASSGKTVRHRLNRGGDRQANRALSDIAKSRMQHDGRTIAYVAKRTAEGKTKREIKRCLKRYIAREAYHALRDPKAASGPDGTALREARLSLGLTQAQAASMLKVWNSQISRIERGAGGSADLVESYRSCLERLAAEAKRTEKET